LPIQTYRIARPIIQIPAAPPKAMASNPRGHNPIEGDPERAVEVFQMQPSVVLLSRDLFLADEIERLKISGSKKETASILYFTGVAYG